MIILGCDKFPTDEDLPKYWPENKAALLNYMNHVSFLMIYTFNGMLILFLGSLWRLRSRPGQIWSTNQRCDNFDKGQQPWDNYHWNWRILAIIATRWIWNRCRPKWRFSRLHRLPKVGCWPMQWPRLSYSKRLHRMSHIHDNLNSSVYFLQFSLFLQDSFPCLRIANQSTWLISLRTLSWIILFKNKSEKKI